jgi:Carboxypeptidase regulatory-like domain
VSNVGQLPGELVHTPYHVKRLVPRAALLMTLVSSAVAAQPRTGVITGSVKDQSGTLLSNVEVVLPKTGATVHTDSLGRFVLSRLSPGMFDVSLRRLSYSPMMINLEVTEGDTTDVEVTLNSAAEILPTVVVKGKEERKRQLDGFEHRRKIGLGHFITRAQIESRNPLVLSEMVRGTPGAQLTPTNIMGRMTLRFSRRADCPPAYFVDGQYLINYNIDDMPVRDVEGVELYAGFAGLPQEFAKQMGIQACGAVIIWTRIPGT